MTQEGDSGESSRVRNAVATLFITNTVSFGIVVFHIWRTRAYFNRRSLASTLRRSSWELWGRWCSMRV
jgi:hypothetical protein